MRLGVIADLHANIHALDACLERLKRDGVDELVCLGDLVGYGPRPNEVVERISSASIKTVIGNHDLVAAGVEPLERAGETARPYLRWTRDELTEDSRAILRALPRTIEIESEVVVTHGAFDDPWRYIRRAPDAVAEIGRMRERGSHNLLLVGHTHRQMFVDLGTGTVAMSEWILARDRRTLRLAGPALLNPGAVGQSREPRARARCAIVDLEGRSVELLVVRYRDDLCRRDLAERGLPEHGCHARPTLKKTIRQSLRDAEDRRYLRRSETNRT
jgi:predicted phosphodiesterase